MTLIAEEIGLMSAINGLVSSMSGLTVSMVTVLSQLQLQIDILKNMFVFVIWGSLALMFLMGVGFYIVFRGKK